MKEVLVYENARTEMIDSPIPTADIGKVVIKVEVSGTNPKDWKTWWIPQLPINMGDDFAGTIHEVGQDVTGFKVGDRVFALHEIQAPHGSYAEYAVAWAFTTAHLPLSVSFEEAATIPLAALTASLALYRTLRLPQPWAPATVHEPTPLLVYGGSSAVGAFAIKLAVASNLHPIVAVAGAGSSYVSSLLDPAKGDAVIDYRSGRAHLQDGIRSALSKTEKSTRVVAALDTICKGDSAEVCISSLGPQGRLAHVLPLANLQLLDSQAADLVMINYIYSSDGESLGYRDFAYIMMQAFTRGLETGWFRGHPHTNVPGGLCSVGKILADLKSGKASAIKYVFSIRETEGL